MRTIKVEKWLQMAHLPMWATAILALDMSPCLPHFPSFVHHTLLLSLFRPSILVLFTIFQLHLFENFIRLELMFRLSDPY